MSHKRSKQGQAKQSLRKLEGKGETLYEQYQRLLKERRDRRPLSGKAQRDPPPLKDQRRSIISGYAFHDPINSDIVYTEETANVIWRNLRAQFGDGIQPLTLDLGEVLNRPVERLRKVKRTYHSLVVTFSVPGVSSFGAWGQSGEVLNYQ